MKIVVNDEVLAESIDMVTRDVVKYMKERNLKLCTAESCTGGMIAQTVTSVSGASEIFLGGVCSYTEEIKMKILGVKEDTLEKYTVYSAQVADEMSSGAIGLFGADAAVGVTGIAGPGGGTDKMPVGTVFVSVRTKDNEICRNLKLYESYEDPGRDEVRKLTTLKALEMVLEILGKKGLG